MRDKLDQIFTQDDKLTDGNSVTRPMYGKFFHYTDTVGMELRSIDEQVFNYLNQAEENGAKVNPEFKKAVLKSLEK